MNALRLVTFVFFGLLVKEAEAIVYRCDIPGGKVEYRQLPCTNGRERTLVAPDKPDVATGAASISLYDVGEPEIVGPIYFREQVKNALDLLRLRAPSAYGIVLIYVRRIEQAPHSGMRADGNPPTFLMSDATAMYSITWAAASIAHDSYHSKLYHDYRDTHSGNVPPNVWGGIQAEVKCMTHQLTVMQLIGSNQLEFHHANSNADGHYTKNGETKEERDLKPY